MKNNLGKDLNDLNQSLKTLYKYAKGLSDLILITAELQQGQSRQTELFDKFNNFIWRFNQKFNYDFKMFDMSDSIQQCADYFNYVVSFINEKHNRQIPYVAIEMSYDQVFDVLYLMEEVVGIT